MTTTAHFFHIGFWPPKCPPHPLGALLCQQSSGSDKYSSLWLALVMNHRARDTILKERAQDTPAPPNIQANGHTQLFCGKQNSYFQIISLASASFIQKLATIRTYEARHATFCLQLAI